MPNDQLPEFPLSPATHPSAGRAPNRFFRATTTVCILGVALSTVLIVYLLFANLGSILSNSALLSSSLFYVCVYLWKIGPYVVLELLSLVGRRHRAVAPVVFVGAVLTMAAGEALLYFTLFVHPDAQSALGLIIIPLDQWIAVTVLAVIVGPLYYFTRARQARRT